jgi:ElaB/YqjD/DUF883 family membrane-anchored ribosome-binding protein
VSFDDNKSLKEFIRKRNQIEIELNQLQNDLGQSVTSMKDSIIDNIIPTDRIRKKPFKAVGIAALAGFVLGLKKIKKKKSGSKERGINQDPGVTHLMFDEIKRMAAQKAARVVMDIIDRKISERIQPSESENQSDIEQ